MKMLLIMGLLAAASATPTPAQLESMGKVEVLKTEILKGFGDSPDIRAVLTALDATKAEVADSGSSFDASTFNSAVAGVGGQIRTLRTGDKYQKAIAVLKILQTVSAAAGGPIGGPVSSVFAVSAQLLAIATGNDKSQTDIIEEIVKKNIKEQYRNEMSDQISGAKRSLSLVGAIQKSYMNKDWKSLDEDHRMHEVKLMLDQIKLSEGIDLLGKLESFIEREGKAATDATSVNNALKMIEGYSVVNSIRLAMLHQLITIVERSGTAGLFVDMLKEVIRDSQNEARMFLSKTIDEPTDDLAHLAAGFYPEEQPVVAGFMQSLALDPEKLTPGIEAGKCYRINLARDEAWFLKAKHQVFSATKSDGIKDYYAVGGTKKTVDAAKGKWKFERDPLTIDYKMTNTGHPAKPVKVSSNLKELWLDWTIDAKSKTTSDKHKFRIVKTASDKYFIVNKVRRGHPVKIATTLFNKIAFTAKAKGEANAGEAALWKFQTVAC